MTENEKRLGVMFIILVVIAAGVFGFTLFTDYLSELDLRIEKKRKEWNEFSLAEKRKPAFSSVPIEPWPQDGRNVDRFLQSMKEMVKKSGLTLSFSTLRSERGKRFSYQFSASGNQSHFYAFLELLENYPRVYFLTQMDAKVVKGGILNVTWEAGFENP